MSKHALDQITVHDRTVDCVNAMEGIDDPAAFVAAAKELRATMHCSFENTFIKCGGKCHRCVIMAKFDAALKGKCNENAT